MAEDLAEQAVAPGSTNAPLASLDRAHLPLLCAVLLLAIATRFYQLGTESLWGDEAITFDRARQGLDELIADTIAHYHNPTYFLLMHAWLKLGDSEAMLRAPSAIFGVLKIAAVYALGRAAVSGKVGLCAALVVALNPAQLRYDQEARMYALYGFGVALALTGLLWLVRHPEAAALRIGRMRRDAADDSQRAQLVPARRAWWAFATGAVVALYAHNTAVLFVTACSCVALLVLATRPHERRRFLQNWVVVNLLVVAVFAPFIPSLFAQAGGLSSEGFWAEATTAEQTLKTLRAVFLMGENQPVLSVLVALLAVWGSWSLRRSPQVLGALWIMTIAGPGLLGLVGFVEPMFVLRLMLWSAIPFGVIVGAGLAAPKTWPPCAALVVALLWLGGTALHRDYYERSIKPRWREAITEVSANYMPGDRVFGLTGREAHLLRYYFKRSSDPIKPFTYRGNTKILLRDFDTYMQDAKRVWTIQARNMPIATTITDKVLQHGKRVWRQRYGGNVVVARYRVKKRRGA